MPRARTAALPYENATTGKRALAEMEKILRDVGASKFAHAEDFDGGDITVAFVVHKQPISLKVSARGYAAAWLKRHPYTWRMRITEVEHARRALALGRVATWSILRDWLKAQVAAIEAGLLTWDEAFLAQTVLPGGETVMQRVKATQMLRIGRE